jgi:hypothetical protein
VDPCTNIGFSAIKGPRQGSAQVYVDGKLKTTINLYAKLEQDHQLVWAENWTTFGYHTVKIVNLATAGHPRLNWQWFPIFTQCDPAECPGRA